MNSLHIRQRLWWLARIWYHDARKAIRWSLRRRFGWRVRTSTKAPVLYASNAVIAEELRNVYTHLSHDCVNGGNGGQGYTSSPGYGGGFGSIYSATFIQPAARARDEQAGQFAPCVAEQQQRQQMLLAQRAWPQLPNLANYIVTPPAS